MSRLATLVLAAGQSTRIKSKTSKVMHLLAGRPIVSYPIAAARGCGAKKILVVRSPNQDDLRRYLKERDITWVVQKEPLGTANAVQAAKRALAGFRGLVLVLYGDVPLLRVEALKAFLQAISEKEATLGVITMTLDNPVGYGRIVRDLGGEINRIVEEKEAIGEEQEIKEVNSGIICADCAWLMNRLGRIGRENMKGEFYLTDLIAIAVRDGAKVVGFKASPPEDFLGINTRVDLSRVADLMRERINRMHMLAGVGILDPRNTSVDVDVRIGQDTTIMPYSFLLGQTRIGSDCIIENGVVLRDAILGDGVHVKAHSVVEESVVADGAVVGPFARIRPDSRVGRGARVGNFVELKKCNMKDGAKANHLTYLGDATVGRRANIGCGTITCNYDGFAKHRTVIGDGAFIGSDVQFVAPVRIGRSSTIGAGSTITKDVPPDSLSLSRAEQKIIRGWKPRRK